VNTLWVFLVALVLLGSACAVAQAPVAEEMWEDPMNPDALQPDSMVVSPFTENLISAPQWHEAVTNIPGDWFHAGEETFRIDAMPAIFGIGFVTGGLLLIDHRAYEATSRLYRQSRTSRRIFEGVRFAGDGRAALGLAASFALFGAVTGDKRSLSFASHATEALFASGIMVQILKRVSGRESPEMASRPAGMWRPFPKWSTYNHSQARYYSFPSGHVTTTMAIVTVLANDYPEVTWLRPAGYAVVGLVGVSLVGTGWHWYSDFPVAIALGYVFGNLATSHHSIVSTPEESDRHASLDIRPVVGSRSTGLGLVYSF
jgi:membrane-associated phospholipid phosphatase